MSGKIGNPDASVLDRTTMFHSDSVLCGISAIALNTNAPVILRAEAAEYPNAKGAAVFGSTARVAVEKAIVANSNAVREWDSNGTNFGFNPSLGHTAGEFGHNDFYPVAIAAAEQMGRDGAYALRGMVAIDEIRGRLAEVFSLKTYKIDHVVHGAIASAAVYGAMTGATAEQIESAIGMTVAHYIPWRAIRAGWSPVGGGVGSAEPGGRWPDPLLLVPERRWVLGLEQGRSQPCARLPDGSSLSLY